MQKNRKAVLLLFCEQGKHFIVVYKMSRLSRNLEYKVRLMTSLVKSITLVVIKQTISRISYVTREH